jgi:hypothetical protein
MSEIRASTINAKNIDDGPTRKCCRRSVSTHHQHKKYRRWALWEATPEIRARPPLTQKTSTTGPMPSWGVGGVHLHPGFKRCVVKLHGYDRQKSSSAHGSHFSMLGPVMANDPWLTYGAWVIQCDIIYVMVMALFRGMRCPDPQYSAVSVREAKYTH